MLCPAVLQPFIFSLFVFVIHSYIVFPGYSTCEMFRVQDQTNLTAGFWKFACVVNFVLTFVITPRFLSNH